MNYKEFKQYKYAYEKQVRQLEWSYLEQANRT